MFSVKDRRPLLQDDSFREATWAYMAGVCRKLEGFALIVGGYYDHAHLLVRIPAKIAVSDFVGRVKANTSKHINDSRDAVLDFHWQGGWFSSYVALWMTTKATFVQLVSLTT